MEGHFKAQNASEERHLRACWFPSIRLNCKLIVSIAAYHYLAVKRLLHLDGHLPLVLCSISYLIVSWINTTAPRLALQQMASRAATRTRSLPRGKCSFPSGFAHFLLPDKRKYLFYDPPQAQPTFSRRHGVVRAGIVSPL